MSLLAFALKNKGLLFLGPSETLGRHANDFKELDGTHKLFQKMRDSHRRLPTGLVGFSPKNLPSIQSVPERDQTISIKSKKALHVLLQRYVPPSLLINTAGELLHAFGNAGEYLKVAPGESSLNIRSMVSGPARSVLTHMLHHVNKTHKPVQTRYVEGFAGCESADISLQPLSESASDADYLLMTVLPSCKTVVTEPLETEALELIEHGVPIDDNFFTSRVHELEEELQFTRESLQTTVEELETSNEELQSSNEELMAANEELQSTNEELQSVNEELVTVNSEYQSKEKERAEIAADEKSIIESSGIGILFLDEQLNIRKFSDTAARIFHLVPGDFNRPIGAISGALARDITGDVQLVLQNGGFIEKDAHHESGSVYQMRIQRMDDEFSSIENPSIRGVILTFINITKLFSSQQQLMHSERRFHSMVDALSDGYFEWKPRIDSLYLSDALKSTLGYEISATLSWSALLPQDKDNILQLFSELPPGQSMQRVLVLKQRNGSLLWVLCKARAIAEPALEYRIEGQLVNMQDFKQQEAELRSQMHNLQRSNDILEEFAYIVSHDLKAPLRHSLHTLDYLIESRSQGNAETEQQQIDALKEHLQSLQSLIDDVIRFSRFRTQPKQIVQQNLNQIVEEIQPILQSNFSHKAMRLSCDQLPTIRCDPAMMRHLFQNLLHNACKYNDKPDIEIDIRCQRQDEQVQLTISDNGIGFDTRFVDEIFKPFKRLVTKTQFDGSGVGLAICKMIVEHHGGSISATSQVGQGSQFTVTLPITV